MSSNLRYILGIDSAVNGCGVCVYNVGEPEKSVKHILEMSRGQAEALVPAVQNAVEEAGIQFNDIGLIATTIGPGTFTGLRVGLSAAKSFAMSLSVPVKGFSTMEVIAKSYFDDHSNSSNLCVLLESRREDYYCQIWDQGGQVLLEPSALVADEILKRVGDTPTVFIGDALERFKSECGKISNFEFADGYKQPDPFILSKMGAFEYMSNQESSGVEPLYLRGADVSKPKAMARKIQA